MLSIITNVFLLIFHPFYVSIAAVDYNEKAQSVEVSCRIFYDDLEDALKAGGGKRVDLINPTAADKRAMDSLLAGYLLKHFRLAVNGEQVNLRYLGYEIEDDVAWCYLEANNIRHIANITIDNRILFGQFPKQSNIMHITANGKRKSAKLDNPKSRAVFEFADSLVR
ncbi:DUF6702 family protein [Parapedobacter tibetensis]|uniref:DUF6702 family protein n=1 Tax=Parapedobacter tibetensis TaxID=2972951 RepID=UPI00214D848B|nr:DUF6702 family protein [Parapedobacter tibetensis]